MANIQLTPAGWQLTKTNRLKSPPYEKRPSEWYWENGHDVSKENEIFKPLAQVGDTIHIYGRGVSAGTVGKIINIGNEFYSGGCGYACDVEFLDGAIESEWLSYCIKITPDMLQEVKDFYINDGRASRIKVTW